MNNVILKKSKSADIKEVIPKSWKEGIDPLIPALWSLIEDSISFVQPVHSRFEMDQEIGCQIFGNDPIALPLMKVINRKLGYVQNFKVSQYFPDDAYGANKFQRLADLLWYRESWRGSQLVLAPGSNFAVLIGPAQQGQTIAVWDLRITKVE